MARHHRDTSNRDMLQWIKDLLKTIFFKLYLNFIGAVYLVKENVVRPRRLPNYGKQDGRTVVITGGGRGIGEEAIKKFLMVGMKVIIGCRSPDTVQTKFDDLISGDEEKFSGSVKCLYLDLMRMESVKTFAGSVLALESPIHVLVNNAGIMFGPRRETEDGYESQLATNYLGHFLLTHLLLPPLTKSAADNKTETCRIVNVSSCAHYMGSWMDWNDLHLNTFYSPEQSYGNSKAAQIMSTRYLGNMLDTQGHNIRVVSIHPGVVFTDLYVNVWWMKIFSLFARLVMKTPEQGGDTIVHAVLDQEMLSWGQSPHLENHRESRVSSWCQSRDNQEKLWRLTCDMLQINNFGQ